MGPSSSILGRISNPTNADEKLPEVLKKMMHCEEFNVHWINDSKILWKMYQFSISVLWTISIKIRLKKNELKCISIARYVITLFSAVLEKNTQSVCAQFSGQYSCQSATDPILHQDKATQLNNLVISAKYQGQANYCSLGIRCWKEVSCFPPQMEAEISTNPLLVNTNVLRVISLHNLMLQEFIQLELMG